MQLPQGTLKRERRSCNLQEVTNQYDQEALDMSMKKGIPYPDALERVQHSRITG